MPSGTDYGSTLPWSIARPSIGSWNGREKLSSKLATSSSWISIWRSLSPAKIKWWVRPSPFRAIDSIRFDSYDQRAFPTTNLPPPVSRSSSCRPFRRIRLFSHLRFALLWWYGRLARFFSLVQADIDFRENAFNIHNLFREIARQCLRISKFSCLARSSKNVSNNIWRVMRENRAINRHRQIRTLLLAANP